MRNKKILLLGIPIIVIFLVTGFYWFQVRPAQIKHDCSWIKEYVGGEPARLAMTEEEVSRSLLLKDCEIPQNINRVNPGAMDKLLIKFFTPEWQVACEKENQRLISVYSKPRTAIPAKLQTRKTTNAEYTFCLHDKGL